MKFYSITHSSNQATLPNRRCDLRTDVYNSYLQTPFQQTTINQTEQPTQPLIESSSTSHKQPALQRKRKRMNCPSIKKTISKFDVKLNQLRITWKAMHGVEEHFPSDVILFRDMSKIKLPSAQHLKRPTKQFPRTLPLNHEAQIQHQDNIGVYDTKSHGL